MSMTAQEIFDTVAKHLITQGRPSTRGDGKCLYRLNYSANDTIKCAFGVLIPDSLYVSDMERYGAGTLIEKYPKIQEIVGEINKRLSVELQAFHDGGLVQFDSITKEDGTFDLTILKEGLRKIAHNFELNTDILTS